MLFDKKKSEYDIRFNKALVNEHNKLFDGTNELKDEYSDRLNACPSCNTKEYSIFCVKDLFVHKQCSSCGLVYVDPRMNQDATISFYNSEVNEIYNEIKFYNLNTTGPDDHENLKNYDLLISVIGNNNKGKKLLEIGCGKGTFLAKAAEGGFDVYGVELNKVLISKLKQITQNIYTNDLLDLDLPDASFDVIYFRDVAEHIPNINPFLSKISALLKPGGTVFIDTHNIESIANRLTKQYHTVVFAFEHPIHWSPKSLTLAAERAGLRLKHLHLDHKYQRLGEILWYYLYPSFTYIFPPKRNKLYLFFLKCISLVINRPVFRHIDYFCMQSYSKLTKRGTKMQIFYTK